MRENGFKGQMQRNLDNFSFVEKPLQNSQLYQREAESALKNKFCATCDVPKETDDFRELHENEPEMAALEWKRYYRYL